MAGGNKAKKKARQRAHQKARKQQTREDDNPSDYSEDEQQEQQQSAGFRGPDKEFYTLLEVETDASPDTIKKAYRQQILKHHPDKGGDEATFKRITFAYEVLTDPAKKDIYDRIGEKGLNDHLEKESHKPSSGNKKKSAPIIRDITLTLVECYTGKRVKMIVNRERICATCDGTGCKSRAKSSCGACGGQGSSVFTMMTPYGPRRYSERCRTCQGKGSIIKSGDRCTFCSGNGKSEPERAEITCDIPPGAAENCSYPAEGAGDHNPDCLPGDVLFRVTRVEPHPVFRRDGDNLQMSKTISLTEALCGVAFVITHLDGHRFVVRSYQGQVLKPNSQMCVEHEGMPLVKNPFLKGHLTITFNVEFPNRVPTQQTANLMHSLLLFSPIKPENILFSSEGLEEHILVDYKKDQHASQPQEKKEAYGAEEEEESEYEEGDEDGGYYEDRGCPMM